MSAVSVHESVAIPSTITLLDVPGASKSALLTVQRCSVALLAVDPVTLVNWMKVSRVKPTPAFDLISISVAVVEPQLVEVLQLVPE